MEARRERSKTFGMRWPRLKTKTRSAAIAAGLGAALATGGVATFAGAVLVGPRSNNTAVIPNGWVVTPAGRQVQLGDRPYGMALSPDGRTLLISNDGQSTQSLMVVDRASGSVVQTIAYDKPEALYIGVAWSPDGTHAYASAGGNDKIRIYDVTGQHLNERASIKLPANSYPAGLAIAPDGSSLYVAENLADSLAIVDLRSNLVRGTAAVGRNPYTVALSHDGRTAYVSNWGAQSISVVNTAAGGGSATIAVGTHPSAMALNPQRDELYVANTDSDSISVVDTRANTPVRTIDLAPYAGAQEGSSPNALALSPSGATLYVANAGNNDVAVIHLAGMHPGREDAQDDQGDDNAGNSKQGRPRDRILGMIPTAWYPTGIAVAPDGRSLYVANGKGLGAGPNPDGPNPYRPDTPPNQYVGSMIRGTLSIIGLPNSGELKRYTRRVIQNNGFDERDKVRVAGTRDEQVVPRRIGDRSPIKHVIYVIKENRTFDQVFGSLGKGNGDPSLNLFGEESAPNQRALQRRFVTLDNFYADAEVSADGWNWSTAAYANTYVQKNWPANYGGRNRPYDFEGGNFATAPSRDPQNAYLWDRVSRAGITFRNYGFFVFGGVVAPTEPELAAQTDLAYPGYNLAIKDQVRADEFLREFHTFEASGNLPRIEFVRLPNDHTSSTRPGAPTPRAMMADNDYALGRIVDAVSHSRFWSETAIFVVEDDAQNGPDHVDAHRTIAQLISPYTQTGKVDSTLYSTVSMLRTIELILGVRPLRQFDAAATPMLNSVSSRANTEAYTAIKPQQSLDERNDAASPMAAQSQQMDLSVEDRAPEQLLNQAIWQSVKGAGSQMPTPKTGIRSSASSQRGDGDD